MGSLGPVSSRSARRALAAVVLGSQLACQEITFRSARWEAAQAEVNRRYTLWKGSRPAHYEYRFNRQCECPADLTKEVIVEVTDSTIVAVTYTDGSGAVPASAFSSYFTVEGLFGQIQIAINQLADSLRVEYDATLHYPRVIIGDLNVLVADDELALYASELVAKQE